MHRLGNAPRTLLFAAAAVAMVLAFFALLGCSVSEQKNGRGSEDAEIRTPVGGLKVQTNIDPKQVGLAVYPGARLKPAEDSGNNDKSANVNISTPFFGLRVIALDYETDDPPQKILDFYKKDMARYGKVSECKGTSGDVNTGNGDDIKLSLKCDDTGSGNSTELKAGEGNSQHIVGVTPRDKGTEFGLVYIHIRGKAETM